MSYQQYDSLLTALTNCAAACNYCATACLDGPDVKMLTTCIKLDMDCADICTVTASLMARDSAHGKHLLKECFEVCNACADECEKHADMGMQHCKDCAEACRECAKACSGF